MVSFRITKNGFIGNGSGSLTGSLLGTASHAITASSVAWNDVTGKPSVYPAAAHNHTGDNLKPTSVTTTGDVTVGGNLIVNGVFGIGTAVAIFFIAAFLFLLFRPYKESKSLDVNMNKVAKAK